MDRLAAAAPLILIVLGLPGAVYPRGVEFLVAIQTNSLAPGSEWPALQADTVASLRRRLKSVALPNVTAQSDGRILVQLAGLGEADQPRARTVIEKCGLLSIHLVHPDSRELVAQGIVEPGYTNLVEVRERPDGSRVTATYLVKKEPERGLTGKYIKRAYVARDPTTQKPEILFELDSTGAKLFEDITREYQPQGNRYFLLAVVLDGELYSAPRINEPIPGGRVRITGSFTEMEAFALACVLESPIVPVRIVEERPLAASVERAIQLRHAATFLVPIGILVGCLSVVVWAILYFSLRRSRQKSPV